MRLRFLLCCVAVVMSACSTNVSSSYKLDAATGKGLIVGTITHTSYGGEYYVNLYGYQLSKTTKLSVGSANWHPFTQINDSDLKARGDTFAVEVPAGDYLLGEWAIRQGSFRYWGNRELGFRFKVEAGKVTYIGNIHFVDKEYVNLQEMEKRDLPVIEARYPAVKASPLAFKIEEGTKLEKLGGSPDWKMKMPYSFLSRHLGEV